MNILMATLALAATQAGPVDHSQHSPTQHVRQQGQHAQHQNGQHQDHSEMMKHCQDMMAKMHKSIHGGDSGQHSGLPGQDKGRSGK